MENTKKILKTAVNSQKKAMNSFVETANKFQEAFKTGKALEQSTEIYKDWWESQMSIFKDISTETKSETEKTFDSTIEKTEDFYKNIYTNQIESIKKASDFNLNFLNTLSNFGKSNNEKNEDFAAMNSNWNTLFESWTKTLNSTYDTLSKTMPTGINKDVFQNAFNTNSLYLKLQEFYQPFFNASKTNIFSTESIKNMFDQTQYKKITEELFTSFFPANNLNTLLQNNAKMIQEFINSKQNTNTDFQNFWKVFSETFPHIFSGDITKYSETFKNINNSYSELFSPMMKLISDSKEKETLELTINSLDKASIYSVKLAQMQQLLYTTGQNVAQESLNLFTEKSKDASKTFSLQPYANEWISLNEKKYTELFATDEFSKLKSELLTLSMEIKKNLEKQFENKIENLPLVVKSEINELYKTIHDLKKAIKSLESKFITVDSISNIKTTSKKATV